jgi:RNA recognition motif-containing protein
VQKRGIPEACLFVASLSSQKSTKQLQKSVHDHFSQWGPLLNVVVNKDSKHRPFAFVQFESVQDADTAAMEASSTKIDGRLLRIERAKVNRTLMVKHIQGDLNEKRVREIMSQVGPIELLEYDPNHQQAIIKYRYREDAVRAITFFRFYQWTTQWQNQLYTVHISNIHPQTTQNEITKEFKRFGEIVSVSYIQIMGKSGVCVVKYSQMNQCMRLDGHLFHGQPIKVEPRT